MTVGLVWPPIRWNTQNAWTVLSLNHNVARMLEAKMAVEHKQAIVRAQL